VREPAHAVGRAVAGFRVPPFAADDIIGKPGVTSPKRELTRPFALWRRPISLCGQILPTKRFVLEKLILDLTAEAKSPKSPVVAGRAAGLGIAPSRQEKFSSCWSKFLDRFVLYWIVSAIRTRDTLQQRPSLPDTPFSDKAAGFFLLFRHSAGNWISWEIESRIATYRVRSWARFLTWMGIGPSGHAINLAEYWSARITIKEDHPTDPHRSLYSPATPHLFRYRPGGDRFGSGD